MQLPWTQARKVRRRAAKAATPASINTTEAGSGTAVGVARKP
jgi:hypothetical protein